MRRSNLCWISLLGFALLVVPACTDSNLDNGDSANVVLQMLDLQDPVVKGQTQIGTCTVSGAQCLDSSQCDALDPTDVCFIDPTAATCIITEWSATLANAPKSALATESPFSDIALTDVTVSYEWLNGFVMDPFTVALSGSIEPSATRIVKFFPMSSEDLAALRAAFPLVARSANVTLRFRGKVENGDDVERTAGAQLFVEACN